MITASLSSSGELLLPQDIDWTLVFISFLSRHPSHTDNQIYLNNKTRIWNPILLALILCTVSFQITMSSSMLCSLSFDSSTWKIWNLFCLSLVSFWNPCSFYRSFCYLQNVDFEGSHQNWFRIIVFWIPSLPIRLYNLSSI